MSYNDINNKTEKNENIVKKINDNSLINSTVSENDKNKTIEISNLKTLSMINQNEKIILNTTN